MNGNGSVGAAGPGFHHLAASQKPGKVFLEGPSPLRYGELCDRIGALTAHLATTALAPGDRVVIGSSDVGWLATLFFGLIDNGLTSVVTSPDLTARELDVLCEVTRPAGCVMDAAILSRCAARERPWKTILPIEKPAKRNVLDKLLRAKKPDGGGSHLQAVLAGHSPVAPPDSWPDDQIAYVMMTSGSTSRPKAVPCTRRALFAHLHTLRSHFGYGPESRILNLLPLSHADGLVQGPSVACASGATWLRPFEFSIANIEPLLHSVYGKRATHFVCVPTILSLLLRLGSKFDDSFRTDDFQFIVSAAGHLEEKLWKDFQETFGAKVVNLYGLTETVTGGLFSGPDDGSHRVGTIGKPVDCEARIVDEAGREVAPGETGELLLRGDNVFSGYLGATEVNQDVFLDGWLRTGDLASRDTSGFYRIEGRIKNVVISGGENIHPEEVTELIQKHPDVAEAVTFGVPHREWGENLVALVVAKSADDDATVEQALIAWCRERLSGFKVPKDWLVVDALPHGPSGKVLVPQARQLYLERRRRASSLSGGGVEANVLSIAAQTFHCARTALDLRSSPENTSGWDSLAHVNLVLALEAAFDIELTTTEIMQIADLRTTVTIIESKLARDDSER
jgi:long-chain acyl-CoA synthetase